MIPLCKIFLDCTVRVNISIIINRVQIARSRLDYPLASGNHARALVRYAFEILMSSLVCLLQYYILLGQNIEQLSRA